MDIDDADDLEKKIDFTVFEQPADVIPVPSGECTESVMLCCCINRGDVHMKAHCGKNYYYPGEQGTAIMEVTNNSKSDLSPAVELNQWLQARKRHFWSHLYIKINILPRQARDEHRENSKKVPFSLSSAQRAAT